MIQQMIAGSVAVVTRPRLASFEEHQRDSLGWALAYVLIGAVINALLLGAGMTIQLQFTRDQLAVTREQLAGTPFERLIDLQTNPLVLSGLTLVATPFGFLLFVGLLYLLARVLGGQGPFGRLAYSIALFLIPIGAVTSLVSMASVGLLACLVLPITLALSGYSIYLNYLSVRTAMSLSSERTIAVIAIYYGITILLSCVVGLAVAAAVIGAVGGM